MTSSTDRVLGREALVPPEDGEAHAVSRDAKQDPDVPEKCCATLSIAPATLPKIAVQRKQCLSQTRSLASQEVVIHVLSEAFWF